MRTLATIAVCLMLSGSAIAQETTTAEQLREVLDDIKDWPPDYERMHPKLAKALKKQKSKVLKQFKQAGRIESVEFIESFRGADLYYVKLRKRRWFMRFERAEDGEILTLRYWTVGW